MKDSKTIIIISLFILGANNSHGQTMKKSLMLRAISYSSQYSDEIVRAGYSIKAMSIRTTQEAMTINEFDIKSDSNDTIFVEALTFVDKKNYGSGSNAFTASKETRNINSDETKYSLIGVKSEKTSLVGLNNETIDKWKINFLIDNQKSDFRIFNNYHFYLSLIWPPVEDKGTLDGTLTNNNLKREKNDDAFIIIVYTKK